MAPLKFCSFRQFANDSLYLQSALAARLGVFSAGLPGQNVSPRQLPRKIRSTFGYLRCALKCPTLLEESILAACGQCRGGDDCPEIGPANAYFETESGVCPDDDNYHGICLRK